jgi:hypothetical protein
MTRFQHKPASVCKYIYCRELATVAVGYTAGGQEERFCERHAKQVRGMRQAGSSRKDFSRQAAVRL